MPTFFAGQTDYIEKLNDVDAAAGAAQDDIDAHIADTTAAHAASAISNTPAGNIAATSVQGAINELDSEKLSASATALPSSFASASLNSVTPSGGILSIDGSAIVNNRLETQGFQGAFFGNAGGVYTTWGTASPVGDIGTGNVIIGGGSASDFALNVRGANILHLCSGDVSRVAINASGAAVTGSISATSLVDISAAGAGQIKFPATQNASADANTLDDYQEATYTGTATGMTTSPTGTVSYTLTGNEATLNLPEITGTSNATTFTVTGMPAEARPASRKTVLGRAQDNGGAIVPVRIDIETTGVLTIYANADAGAFTASGSKTLAECSVTYTRV